MLFFNKADNEYRSGNATQRTGMAFHRSRLLLEVCKQFTDEYDDDLESKRKWAFKASATITKAIKAGEPVPVPDPGPGIEADVAGQEDFSAPPTTTTTMTDFSSPPPSITTSTADFNSPPPSTTTPSPAVANVAAPAKPSLGRTGSLSFDDVSSIEKAKKATALATSALSFSDAATARVYLR